MMHHRSSFRCAAAVVLPPAIRSRLLLARRVAASLNERLKVLDVLEPTR